MATATELANQLIAEIESAFGAVSRDFGVTLHEAEVIDNYGSWDERLKARQLDRDRKWQDVPDKDIEEHYSILSFLDLKGFHYYIPAFMRWSLRHHNTSTSSSCDSAVFALCPSNKPELRDGVLERLNVFDEEQARVICRFLRYMAEYAENDTARKAVELHWGCFCNP